MWSFAKYGHCISELLCAVILCEYAPEEPSTLLVDVDALYQWTKLSGDCILRKICLLYSLVTGFAATQRQIS